MDRATQITMPDGTKTSNAYRVDGNLQVIWDEENRLRAIADNGYVSSYFYDAAGERTIKLHGGGEGIHVNAAFSGGYTNNVDYTLYVDAYMVLEKGGQYTKHIYIGDQRIVSKLGDVGSFGVDPRREEYAGANVAGVTAPNYKTKYEALQNVIKDNYAKFEVDYYGIDNNDYVNGEGFCCEPKAQAKNARSLPTENVDYEKLQYYYHPDHLGSASYITNLDGEVVQHIEYVPFGEVFLEERNNTWNTPFLFNGKELDEETGLYYYGARYYNPRISLWYGVDPLAEKYPAHSPYCYTMNNPIMLIDPDGRKVKPIWIFDFYSKQHYQQFMNNYNSLLENSSIFNSVIKQLERSSEYFEFTEKNYYQTSGAIYSGFTPTSGGSFAKGEGGFFSEHKISLNNYSTYGDGTNSDKNGVSRQYTIFEEVFHAGQYLYYKNSGTTLTNIQKEVEVRIVRAFSGVFESTETAIGYFANNPYVQNYFNLIKDGKEINPSVQSGYDAAVLNLADDVFRAYSEHWKSRGLSSDFIEKNRPQNNSFENEYFNSIVK